MFNFRKSIVLTLLLGICILFYLAGCSEDDDSVVNAGESELSCQIVAPQDGESIVIGSTIEVEAEIICRCDTVSCVSTFLNDHLVKYDHSDPYIFYWNTTGSAPGNYEIKIVSETTSMNIELDRISVELVLE